MARRKVDTSLLQGLVEHSQNQEVQRGTPRTTDPRFPVFSTPVNQDILVYIPRTNVVVTENGEEMQLLHSHIHQGRIGRQFVSLRCISGLTGNPVFDELGYDGTCPACDATQEAWELYRIKLDAEAKRIGIDPQDDPNDTLKPAREKILSEMDIRGAEEYVTFPVVIIPTKGKMLPADDWANNLEVVFVNWRKQRYDDTIGAALESLMENPGHPAGLFWFWKFSYDTKGKQANARDSARNAKYTIIQDQNALQMYEPIRAVAEEKAKEFTLVKAAEVVVANHFLYKEDLEVEVNKVMAKTRQLLDLAKQGGAAALPQAGQAQGQLPAGGGNPLANFGTAQGSAPANLGQSQEQAQPASQSQVAGQATTQPAGQPIGQSAGQPIGNPIQFGQ